MGKPAARVGDKHKCPQADLATGVPHKGGIIIGPGCTTVLIGGKPAAVSGDVCSCVGAPNTINTITGGSTGVFIGGKPAARKGDMCLHEGKITSGLGSVLIGERRDKMLCKEDLCIEDKLVIGPEQEMIINEAVKKCIVLLERKLQLLERRDENTMEGFEKWFGLVKEFEVQTIICRIQNALNVAKELTTGNFQIIIDEHTRMYTSAQVYSNDEFHRIFLGDLFWNEKHIKEHPQELILAHELSHFDYVGTTYDFGYGIQQCLDLIKIDLKKALYNADSFERFIKS